MTGEKEVGGMLLEKDRFLMNVSRLSTFRERASPSGWERG